jgi:hypothetical protein
MAASGLAAASGYLVPTVKEISLIGLDFNLDLERPPYAPPRVPYQTAANATAPVLTWFGVGDGAPKPTLLTLSGEFQATNEYNARVATRALYTACAGALELIRVDDRSSTTGSYRIPLLGIKRWSPPKFVDGLTYRIGWECSWIAATDMWCDNATYTGQFWPF